MKIILNIACLISLTVIAIISILGISFKVYAKISAVSEGRYDISFYEDLYVYGGTPIEPPIESVTYIEDSGDSEVRTVLREGEDYSLRYSGNVDAGTAQITVYGRGAYTGSYTVEFSILPRELTQQNTVCEIEPGSLNSNIPKVVVICDGRLLIENLDYELSYQNNENAGETAFVIVNGVQNYTGQIKVPFTMYKRNLSTYGNVSLEEEEFSYTGDAICPDINVEYADNGTSETLKKNVDYKVEYVDNVNVGNATAVITGMGDYSGSLACSFAISKESISNCEIEDMKEHEFTGQPICPTPRVMFQERVLTCGKDFMYSYENNISVGNASLGITGINNFSGTIFLSFVINPVESLPEENLNGEEGVTFPKEKDLPVVIKEPSKLTKIVKRLKKGWKITLKWAKIPKAKQYQIWYRKNGKWKKVQTTSGRKFSVTVKKKGNYRYRVRGCYKNIKGSFRSIAIQL